MVGRWPVPAATLDGKQTDRLADWLVGLLAGRSLMYARQDQAGSQPACQTGDGRPSKKEVSVLCELAEDIFKVLYGRSLL